MALSAHAQPCALSLKGVVTDLHTGELMPYVTVYEPALGRGATTDDFGRFQLDNLCAGDLHLEFNHLGCETVDRFIRLSADTTLIVILHHNAELLGEVEVVGEQGESLHVGAQVIGRSEINARSDEDLTSMLTSITGVKAIQNGSALAKPVYQGMSGNRLSILNNGIAQSGQQWGNDHAPEIDAFSADRLTVIQGVNTLAQNGPNLGGMILVEMKPIPNDPHLHGHVNYSFLSNGLGHSLNSRIEKSGDWAAWRMTITGRKIGDRHTPDYFLTNTGNTQLNGSLLTEKDISTRWRSSLYLSSFNTEIGILRGSHIGNQSDLSNAFDREEPFYTEEAHSYNIDNPRQVVNHQLLKFENKIDMGLGILELTYAGQLNTRKEFDVRRGDRDNQAALDLFQHDHFLESTMRFRPDSNLSWKTGIQYRYTRNKNEPGTGILPLVPDYLNQIASAYLLANWNVNKWHIAAGSRLDLKNIYALPISQSLPRVIERYDLWYTNPSGVLTLRYEPSEEAKIETELGYRQRSPEVNELFSNGLHQGVSGIEQGDDQLRSETGLLARLSGSYHLNEKYFITASVYHNQLDDFIYLQPQDELRLTIRGAFPVFDYKQVDATMQGADITLASEIGKHWRLRSSYSFIKGTERVSGLALIGIPANSGSISLHFEEESWKSFENIDLSMSYAYTGMRNDLLADNLNFPDRSDDSPLMGQDFLAPPRAYSLVGMDMSAKRRLGKTALRLGLSVDNLLNSVYRDYLDRQRYFSDAMGRNVKVKIGWEF